MLLYLRRRFHAKGREVLRSGTSRAAASSLLHNATGNTGSQLEARFEQSAPGEKRGDSAFGGQPSRLNLGNTESIA